MATSSERVAKSKAKRQAQRFIFELHHDDDSEVELIELLEQAKENKKLRFVIIQSLTNYFKNNPSTS